MFVRTIVCFVLVLRKFKFDSKAQLGGEVYITIMFKRTVVYFGT